MHTDNNCLMEDAAVIDAKDNALIYIKGREKRKWLVDVRARNIHIRHIRIHTNRMIYNSPIYSIKICNIDLDQVQQSFQHSLRRCCPVLLRTKCN